MFLIPILRIWNGKKSFCYGLKIRFCTVKALRARNQTWRLELKLQSVGVNYQICLGRHAIIIVLFRFVFREISYFTCPFTKQQLIEAMEKFEPRLLINLTLWSKSVLNYDVFIRTVKSHNWPQKWELDKFDKQVRTEGLKFRSAKSQYFHQRSNLLLRNCCKYKSYYITRNIKW